MEVVKLMTTESGNTIEISGKTIAAIVILLLLLVSTFGMFLLKSPSNNNGSAAGLDGIPEKCKLPAGQDANSWKEHLGHHEDTKECLKYFD